MKRRRAARTGWSYLVAAVLSLAAVVRAPAQYEQALEEVLVTGIEASEGLSWQVPETGVSARIVPHEAAGDSPDVGGLMSHNSECLAVTLSGEALSRPRSAVRLAAPIPIRGFTKTLSFRGHVSQRTALELRVIVQDDAGIEYKVPVARLMAAGWQVYTLAIPPSFSQGRAFETGYGLAFVGWELLPPSGTSAPLQIRIDAVSVITDLFLPREPDLPEDW
jgi:hypothetical protein